MKSTRPVLLLSGSPPQRKTSFSRQLASLAAAWHRQGRPAITAGPSIPETVNPARLKALVALGYPDQFPFLQRRNARLPPVFLWSQFSRPPLRPLPDHPTYVPLTPKTQEILGQAGCFRVAAVIPHGVDSDLFAPLPSEQPNRLRTRVDLEKGFVVGCVANNSLRKRFDLIIRSFALLCRDVPHSRLLIKTDRPVSLDGVNLPALVAGEGLEERVSIITEELEAARLVELYNRFDVYLNLSEWEGFCIPVIEAMSCSLPVVCLPIQGPGEILPYRDTLVAGSSIREEEGSVLYAADPEEVARILLELAQDHGLRERLGAAGRAEVLARYDMHLVAARWTGLLNS